MVSNLHKIIPHFLIMYVIIRVFKKLPYKATVD